MYFYNVRLVSLFNDPVESPKFQFIQWLVFLGPGYECSNKFANSFRQSLLCGSVVASSGRDAASETDLQTVLAYFMKFAVDGRLTDQDMWVLMNSEKQLFGRIDAHVTKIYHQKEIAGFKYHSLNVSNADSAKRVEFIIMPFYKPYLLACNKPIVMFHRNVFPKNLSAKDLIWSRVSGEDRLMLFKMDVADRFEFPGFPDIASHTGGEVKLSRRPVTRIPRVINVAEMNDAFRANRDELMTSESAEIHRFPYKPMNRMIAAYVPLKKMPPSKGTIPPLFIDDSSSDEEPSGPVDSSTAGPSGTVRAGPSRTMRAGPSSTSTAGPSGTIRAGPSRTSGAMPTSPVPGSSSTSTAGPSGTIRAGPSRTSEAMPTSPVPGSSSTSTAGPSGTIRAGPSRTSGAMPTKPIKKTKPLEGTIPPLFIDDSSSYEEPSGPVDSSRAGPSRTSTAGPPGTVRAGPSRTSGAMPTSPVPGSSSTSTAGPSGTIRAGPSRTSGAMPTSPVPGSSSTSTAGPSGTIRAGPSRTSGAMPTKPIKKTKPLEGTIPPLFIDVSSSYEEPSGPVDSSRAGPSRTSTAGPSGTVRAGPSRTSGAMPTSPVPGSSSTSTAGPSGTIRAGPSRTSGAMPTSPVPGPSSTSTAGPSGTIRAGSSRTSGAMPTSPTSSAVSVEFQRSCAIN